MVKEKYYIIYNGKGKAGVIAKDTVAFVESIYKKDDGYVLYEINDETKKMLVENNILLADTLHEIDPEFYPEEKDVQEFINEMNSYLTSSSPLGV